MAATRGRTLPHALMGRGLSPKMAALLRDGDLVGEYASRSNAVQATALACANARWTEDDWRLALHGGSGDIAAWSTHQRTKTGHLRPRSAGDAERRLARCWRAATERARAIPPAADAATVRAEIAALRALVDLDPRHWSGQAGVSDHAVLTHLYAIAGKACQLVLGRACRTIALDCQMAPSTAAKALCRLAERGWIRCETPTDGKNAATWRLCRPAGVSSPEHLANILEGLPPRHTTPHGGTVIAHDTFVAVARGGLGRTAARLLDLLDDGAYGGLTAGQLAALSGLHPKTIARHLPCLQALGLASVGQRGGWARTASVADLRRRQQALDELAGQLETLGTLTRRRARIAAERDAREEFHAKRGWAIERGLHQPGQTRLQIAA